MVSAEVKWSGREDQVFNGRKIQRRAAGLSERGSGLSPTVTVGDGQKGAKRQWVTKGFGYQTAPIISYQSHIPTIYERYLLVITLKFWLLKLFFIF
jgi:hypothetical protein